jgi:hypothetical protein
MSTIGERKCALLLASLRKGDQRRLLARLPRASAVSLRALMGELTAMRLPIADLANALLADEVRGLTASTSLDLDQLIDLSECLPPVWFAHVLSVWTSVDRDFCLATLDRGIALEVRRELKRIAQLPPKLVEALRAQAVSLVSSHKAAS